MDKEEVKQFVGARNAETLFQSVKELDLFMRETRSMIDRQNQTINTLLQRITILESTINTMRIQQMGSGPTV